MLFFLTGDIQIGKTRWLERMINHLNARQIETCGVLAPGVWTERENGFEKLGINNLLLPDRKLIPFARRRDLARAANAYDESSQAAQANLNWAIDDDAIRCVNTHFEMLATWDKPARRLLVVDELGNLELLKNCGLSSAVKLLERGASPAFPHAVAVVRKQLLDAARDRFASAQWGGMENLAPNNASKAVLQALF